MEKDERFFTCDGQYVSVYSTIGAWKKIYSIELVAPPKLQSVKLDPKLPLLANLHAAKVGEELLPTEKDELERLIDDRSRLARFAVESAQGEYFLWHKGWNVSVWHLKLGSMISYIYLGLGFMEEGRLSLEDMKAAAPGKVEFLYCDHDTIALRLVVTNLIKENKINVNKINVDKIDVDKAILFSAETGQEQTSVSLCGDGSRTPAYILDRFDLHSDGCTLRMPALPGSDTGNVMRALKLEPESRGLCELQLHWDGFPIASFTKTELYVDAPCVKKPEIKYWNKKYNKGCAFVIPLDDPKVCSKENAELFVGGVQDIADAFTKSKDSIFKEAIIQYLQSHINSTPVPGDDSKSTMFLLCSRINENVNLRKAANCHGIKELVTMLIRSGKWIPKEKYSKGHNPLDVVFKKLGEDSDEEDDVLVIAEEIVRWCHDEATKENGDKFIYILLECMPNILRISRRRPEMVVIANEILQKCYNQALLQNRPENLNYLIKCMPELQALYPVIALKVSRWFAYFPARFRQVIIDNHTISNPPFLSKFLSSDPLQLYDCKNPTLQLHHDTKKPDKDRDYFREDVFVAPFSLLWSIKDFNKPDKKEPNPFPAKATAATKSAAKRRMNYDSDFLMVRMSNETSWWKSLLHLIPSQIIPLQHIYIRPRYYQLEILDNPAIEALVEYKWNTIGYLLWFARFATQCAYYLLIVIAAFMQVYFRDPTVLRYVFVAIIVLALWFLMQEIRQFFQSVKEVLQVRRSKIFSKTRWYRRPYVPRYLKSQYNVLDLLAFMFPLVASFIQLNNINENEPFRAGWILSFSLIIVFLHMLAELRVTRVVCKYVTIVLRIFSEIQVFLAVFALGILFFSLAIEHIVRGRAIGDIPVVRNGTDTSCTNTSNDTNTDGIVFPRHFLAAITSTFFIIGGRYDPVNDELSGDDNWALHIMILIYFFFTVILMLNVLIALINGGFDKADSDWHLVWLENRLRYVESAENMSYRIPGFRQTYDWFPREIYYTAAMDQVTQYKDRMPQDEEKTGNYESILDNTHKSRVPNPDALSQKNVKDHFNTFQKQMDDQLKKRLDEFLKQIPARQWMTSPVSEVPELQSLNERTAGGSRSGTVVQRRLSRMRPGPTGPPGV
ncbi:hypothetical protein BG000_008285 [Podila horticola]|nr:hypothetical protein BG000_008285 [Podila horticola]